MSSSDTIALVICSALVSIFTLTAIGGNDVANSQGTAVGSGALSLRGAQIIAGICEFAGAALVGAQVSNTIGGEMLDREALGVSDLQFCWGMFSALLSVGLWMIMATFIKMPVSATHSIVGAVFGLNLVMSNFDFSSVNWEILGKIAIAWIVTPALSFGASYGSLTLLNWYWPTPWDVDDAEQEMLNATQSLIGYRDNDNEESHTRTSLLSFVMTKPKDFDGTNAEISPRKLGEYHYQPEDEDEDAEKKNLQNDKDNDNKEDNEEEEEELSFTPQKFKFGLIFGIVIATLVIFILVGGPKSINIADPDSDAQVADWVIVIISFLSLLVFVIVGYFFEPFYRKCYIKCVYVDADDVRQKKEVESRKYNSVNLYDDTPNDNMKSDKTDDMKDSDKNKSEVELAVETNKKSKSKSEIKTSDNNNNKPPNATDDKIEKDDDSEREITPYAVDPAMVTTNDVDIYGNDDDGHDTPLPLSPRRKEKGMKSDVNIKVEEEKSPEEQFKSQDYFRLYLIIASGAVAFAHGGNDVANVLGPFGQIYQYASTGSMSGESEIPIYVAGAAGGFIALGFALFGKPVLETIGKSITKLSYRSGFAAQFCSAATVLICNVMGLPVSSSTVIVGGVAGIGWYNARRFKEKKEEIEKKKKERTQIKQNDDVLPDDASCGLKCKTCWQKQSIRILCKILAIWIITIPMNAFFSGAVYAIINLFLPEQHSPTYGPTMEPTMEPTIIPIV